MIDGDNKKNNSYKGIEGRWFQVLLVVIGFLFGIFGTYFLQWKDINYKKDTIAKVMWVGIQREINTAKLLVDTLNTAKSKPGQLAPHGLKYLHDSTTYFSISEDIGLLERDVVIALDAYSRSLKACQAMRDFMYEGLVLLNEDVIQASDYINVYIKQLEWLIETGDATLEVINEKYPQDELHTIRKEFMPKVELMNMKTIK